MQEWVLVDRVFDLHDFGKVFQAEPFHLAAVQEGPHSAKRRQDGLEGFVYF